MILEKTKNVWICHGVLILRIIRTRLMNKTAMISQRKVSLLLLFLFTLIVQQFHRFSLLLRQFWHFALIHFDLTTEGSDDHWCAQWYSTKSSCWMICFLVIDLYSGFFGYILNCLNELESFKRNNDSESLCLINEFFFSRICSNLFRFF